MISFLPTAKKIPRIGVLAGISIVFIFIGMYFASNDASAIVPVDCPVICAVWATDLSGPKNRVCPGWFVTKEYGVPLCGARDVDFWGESLRIFFEYKEAFIEWVRTGQDDFFTVGTRGTLFVTNIDEFILEGGADNAASVFLEEYFDDAYSELCEPFREIVGQGISTSYGRDYGSFKFKAGCTAEEFIQDGGWQAEWFASGWYENNAYGLLALAEAESFERESRAARANELDFLAGNGFPGLRACDEVGVTPGGLCWKYKTNTPGSIIQEQLSDVLLQELGFLVVADEVGEGVVAAHQGLNNWIWSGGSGGEGLLFGITPSGGGQSGSGGGQPSGPGPGGPQQHAVCQNNQCVAADCTPGELCFNECNINDPNSCVGQAQHAECQNNQCVIVHGVGTNECDPTAQVSGCAGGTGPGGGPALQEGYCKLPGENPNTANCYVPVDCSLCPAGHTCVGSQGPNCRMCSSCACNDTTTVIPGNDNPAGFTPDECAAECAGNGGLLLCAP